MKKIGGKNSMKKIVMLSQEIGGKTEQEILQTREKARGCKIGHETAKAYGLNVIYEVYVR